MTEIAQQAPITLAGLRARRGEILAVADLRGATDIRVFGSVARGQADATSDVDFLVEMEQGRSLLDMGALLMDFSDLLGRPVDVVTVNGLRERVRPRVLAEAVPL